MNTRLRLAQTNPRLGNVHSNLDEHLDLARTATGDVDLLLFPELSLTGYFLRDMAYELALSIDSPEFDRLAKASKEITLGVGFVERSPEGQLFNSYAIFEAGELLSIHRKVHLVTYGMFEESRDLAAGDQFVAVDSRCGKLGVLICEDMWHMTGPYLYFLQNCDAILTPSASPARGIEKSGNGLSSVRTWMSLLDTIANLTQTWVAYVNRVGFEDGIGFSGHSCIVEPSGRSSQSLDSLDSGTLDAHLSSAANERARVQTPLRRDEKPWVLTAELERLRQNGGGRS